MPFPPPSWTQEEACEWGSGQEAGTEGWGHQSQMQKPPKCPLPRCPVSHMQDGSRRWHQGEPFLGDPASPRDVPEDGHVEPRAGAPYRHAQQPAQLSGASVPPLPQRLRPGSKGGWSLGPLPTAPDSPGCPWGPSSQPRGSLSLTICPAVCGDARDGPGWLLRQ